MSRLNEIKRRLTAANDNRYRWGRFTIHAPDDIDWLIGEVERQAEEIRSLHNRLLWIAKDNSPHDAQASAEAWAEQVYGPDYYLVKTPLTVEEV